MKGRMTIIVIALVMALIAVAGVATYVTNVKRQVDEGQNMVAVVVAEQNISAGTTGEDIDRNDWASIKMVPKRFIASGAITSVSEIKNRIAKIAIGKGEQLTQNKFDSSLRTAALTIRVSGDMRAITIPVDDMTGVGGVLCAGDKVDVTATFDKDVAGTDTTQTILRDIEVLEVSWTTAPNTQSSDKGVALASDNSSQQSAPTQKKTVTLSVNAADVERLVFAQQKGTIWLSLVPSKSKTVATGGQTCSSVLGR